ncbi:hypothetical protein ACQKCU_14105 [Heyndrickxia sporothermodurans]
MGKQTTRAFALGLLLSAILILIFKPFNNVHNESSVKEGYKQVKITDLEKLQQEKAQLEQKYNSLLTEKNTNTPKQEDKNQTTTKKADNQKDSLIKYRLTIKSGMTPSEIGENLKAAKIINDDDKFVQYLIKRKYHEKIQLGKFNVTNKMNFKQIAVVITKGK